MPNYNLIFKAYFSYLDAIKKTTSILEDKVGKDVTSIIRGYLYSEYDITNSEDKILQYDHMIDKAKKYYPIINSISSKIKYVETAIHLTKAAFNLTEVNIWQAIKVGLEAKITFQHYGSKKIYTSNIDLVNVVLLDNICNPLYKNNTLGMSKLFFDYGVVMAKCYDFALVFPKYAAIAETINTAISVYSIIDNLASLYHEWDSLPTFTQNIGYFKIKVLPNIINNIRSEFFAWTEQNVDEIMHSGYKYIKDNPICFSIMIGSTAIIPVPFGSTKLAIIANKLLLGKNIYKTCDEEYIQSHIKEFTDNTVDTIKYVSETLGEIYNKYIESDQHVEL